MSRWRETLCGSVIKSGGDPTQADNLLKGDTSAVLSCGGSFVPQGDDKPLFARRTHLHLPKHKNEMIIVDSGNNMERFRDDGININKEFEELESAIRHMEAKSPK